MDIRKALQHDVMLKEINNLLEYSNAAGKACGDYESDGFKEDTLSSSDDDDDSSYDSSVI